MIFVKVIHNIRTNSSRYRYTYFIDFSNTDLWINFFFYCVKYNLLNIFQGLLALFYPSKSSNVCSQAQNSKMPSSRLFKIIYRYDYVIRKKKETCRYLTIYLCISHKNHMFRILFRKKLYRYETARIHHAKRNLREWTNHNWIYGVFIASVL